MKSWQIALKKTLSDDDAPPVLTRDLLSRMGDTARRSAGQGTYLPASTLSHWLSRAVEAGDLAPVVRGLYLNLMKPVRGRPIDATPWLQRDSVVSLNTVLGEAGVLSNPSRGITAVAPIDRGYPPPKLGRRNTRVGIFHFFGLPRHILEAGDADDRLEPLTSFDHVRATPEKALVDWLYLGNSPRSRRTPPPRGDIDLDMLNKARLNRLARATGLTDVLHGWKAKG